MVQMPCYNIIEGVSQMTAKKPLILYVLKILEANTDKEHPMKQTQIAEWINDVMSCDRKTVGRNIKILQDMGYPIVKTPKGFFLDTKKFSPEEIKFVLNAVLAAPEKSDADKKQLAAKLYQVMCKVYR